MACPGVADDCPDYVRLQIHVECEDQLRALDMVLIEPAATSQAMVVAEEDGMATMDQLSRRLSGAATKAAGTAEAARRRACAPQAAHADA